MLFRKSLVSTVAPLVLLASSASLASAGDEAYWLHSFQRRQLSDQFLCEGASYGDLSGDGVADLVSGPYWYEGPDFEKRHEIYPPVTFDVRQYSDNFFAWVLDFDGDGRNDVFFIGFPGQEAAWFQNPGPESGHWKRHVVFEQVDNESPTFTDLTGDGKPELVCQTGGRFGYASPDWSDPARPWPFTAISEDRKLGRFTHGLGVGDVDGDGRADILEHLGWYRQPEKAGALPWTYHAFDFSAEAKQSLGVPGAGGAQMYAYDVDGDGDNDIITSLNAHRWGLAWYEQRRRGETITFEPHLIMGAPKQAQMYSVRFAQMHAIELHDMDGDGLRDIVTGVRVWAHHGDASAEPPGVVYWFRLVRDALGGVDWVPQLIDAASGVGTQVVVGDVDGDELPDVVVGNKTGTYFLKHRRERVDRSRWIRAQPRGMHAGLTAERAAEVMTVPEGFELHLAASEPLVHQPIAFAIDERGRLWVAEAFTYPRRVRGLEGKWNEGKDRIIVLEDGDGDGAFETRKVFVENLNLVSGLEVGFGGVWVGSAPYLLFFPDANGDDRADGDPEVLLDGFGLEDTHETLNSFSWGPDGWLYGCHGVFTHSLVGKPGSPAEERVPLNAGFWRYHPLRHEFEVFAWGTSNPWGIDFDDHGQAFATACVIPHFYHVIQGARYQRQAGRHFNPHVYDDIKTIADHRHYAGDIRDHAWWGHEPNAPADTLAAGGGHAHCGAMVYLGGAFPPEYRNTVFMNNIHGNRVNRDIPKARGSGFVAGHGADFVIANDRWFRGIDLQYGPDGSVYLSDWYDRNACHRTNPLIWDRTNGRIYNLRYTAAGAKRAAVNLAALSDAELVKCQLDRNDWYVRTARRILQQRSVGEEVHAALREILLGNPDLTRKLRALWALHVTGGLTEKLALSQLESPEPYVRAWSIQLLAERGKVSDAAARRFARLARVDPSPVVRLYLASALQRLDPARCWEIAEGLSRHAEDAGDHNLPLMIWYGIEPLVAEDAARAMALAESARIELLTRYITRRAASDPAQLDVVIGALNRAAGRAGAERAILDEIVVALRGQAKLSAPPSWKQAFDKLMASADPQVRAHAESIAVRFGDRRIFPKLRAELIDASVPVERRRHALQVLLEGEDREAVPQLQALLGDSQLRGAALRGLARFDAATTPAAIIEHYPGYSAAERADAVYALSSRKSYALALLGAVKAGKVARRDLSAFTIRQLGGFGDETLDRLIREVWGEVRAASSDRVAKIQSYKKILNPGYLKTADLSRGRAIFDRTCATCHTLFGVGETIAPELTGSNRANLDYLLENLLDPNAVVGKDYQLHVFVTTDGRAVPGLIVAESPSALTIRTVEEEVVLPKAQILKRSLSKNSMMPEGLLDEFSKAELRDLVAYLASPNQVPRRGEEREIDPGTRRVAGALEGESLELLEPVKGSAAPQEMGAFPRGKWSANRQLWWTGAKPGDRLQIAFPVETAGKYRVEAVLTRARDYGIVKLSLNGRVVEEALDLYDPEVVTTGTLLLGEFDLKAGKQRLGVEIVGANPRAVPAYMFGLDYLFLSAVAEEDAAGE